MSTATKPLSEIAAQWREARKLYSIYSALLERFALGLPPCRDLESPIDRAEPEAIQRIHEWFVQMDERVHVHQLRQLLQTSKLGTEEQLRSLISHHLEKEEKNEADRDKIDFLLVQYLSSCAPPGFYEKDVTFDEIAQVLEPILGEVGLHPPRWLEPLDKATSELESLRSLRELLEQGTLDQMRKLKAGAGEMYFGPTALVAITRFNFMVRRTFVRLIAADLHAIRFSLHELDRRRVKTVDCARAELSSQESIENLRQICHEWKKPFRAAYAAGQNFRELIEIRTAVEDALAHAPEPGTVELDGADAAPAHAGNGVPHPPTSSDSDPHVSTPPPIAAPEATHPQPEPAAQAATPSEEAGARASVSDSAASEEKTAAAAAATGTPAVAETSPAAAPAVEVKPPSPVNVPIEPEPHIPEPKKIETVRDLLNAAQSAGVSPTAAIAAAAAPAPSPASVETPMFTDVTGMNVDVHSTISQISQEIAKLHIKEPAVASVVMSGVKLMLSSWEVAAYVKGGDETSEALQRAVAARMVMVAFLDRRKKGEGIDMRTAVRMAQLESAKIQARIAVAKQAKDIDAAVNLAATSKRLLSVLNEAEKPAK